MTTPDGPDPQGWSIVVSSGGKQIRSYLVTARQLRRWKWGGLLAVTMGLVGLFGLGIAIPRSVAYGVVLDENLILKARLQDIGRSMAEVDRILLRLRLYDAQLESLGEPTGDHGPLPRQVYANASGAEVELAPIDDQNLNAVFAGAMDEDGFTLTADDLRPAVAWADAVQDRADTFLALFEKAEPDLNQLMESLEDLRALEQALPTTWPSNGTLTSGFGWRRDPMGYNWRFHSGIDIASRRGAPIYAPAAGRVVRALYNQGYGRMIELDHGFGITTLFAHCTTLRVSEGSEVREGDWIATMGSTGQATGPHLHFEVRLDGHAVDPLDYLPK